MKQITFTVKNRDLLNAKPINAKKVVRQVTGLGLKEAKDAVDTLRGMHGNTPVDSYRSDTGSWHTPMDFETKALLNSCGLSCIIDGNEKTLHYVKQIRELACMMIMDGNEALSRDILDVTEKWGYPNE